MMLSLCSVCELDCHACSATDSQSLLCTSVSRITDWCFIKLMLRMSLDGLVRWRVVQSGVTWTSSVQLQKATRDHFPAPVKAVFQVYPAGCDTRPYIGLANQLRQSHPSTYEPSTGILQVYVTCGQGVSIPNNSITSYILGPDL